MPPKRRHPRKVRAATAPDAAETPAPRPAAEAELILLVHADDMVEAEQYKSELEGHGIPAAVGGETPGGGPLAGRGVPVLVSEALAEAAAEVIAELEFTRVEGRPVDEQGIFKDEADDLQGVPDEDLDDDLDEDLDDDLEEDWDEEDDDEDDWDEDDEDDEAPA